MDLEDKSLGHPSHSAVILLRDESTDSLILTKRSSQLKNHPGEISFPGGFWEIGDISYYHTALRELQEELGIRSDRVQLIKAMSTEMTLLGTTIHPWLAAIESLEPYVINKDEVDSILSVPYTLVKQTQNYKKIRLERNGITYVSIQFIPFDGQIWGATARIMKQLASI